MLTTPTPPDREVPLLVDTFMYNGEPIMHYRIHYLYPYVDQFVITESIEAHSGLNKGKYYIDEQMEALSKYQDKIKIVKIPSLSQIISDTPHYSKDGNKNWEREGLQREYALNQIIMINQNRRFILSVCDVDEIPRRELLTDREQLYLLADNPLYLEMTFFYYNFKHTRSALWYHAFLKNDKQIEKTSITHVRQHNQNGRVMKNAGWHMSYFNTIEEIARKIEQFAHGEFNQDEFKRASHILNAIHEGRDIYSRNYEQLIPYKNFSSLPEGWEHLQTWLEYNQMHFNAGSQK